MKNEIFVKLDHETPGRGKNKKCLSCHHLVLCFWWFSWCFIPSCFLVLKVFKKYVFFVVVFLASLLLFLFNFVVFQRGGPTCAAEMFSPEYVNEDLEKRSQKNHTSLTNKSCPGHFHAIGLVDLL